VEGDLRSLSFRVSGRWSPIRARAIAIACEAAKARPESYFAEPFHPHEWVIDAVIKALLEMVPGETMQLAQVIAEREKLRRERDGLANQLVQWRQAANTDNPVVSTRVNTPDQLADRIDDLKSAIASAHEQRDRETVLKDRYREQRTALEAMDIKRQSDIANRNDRIKELEARIANAEHFTEVDIAKRDALIAELEAKLAAAEAAPDGSGQFDQNEMRTLRAMIYERVAAVKPITINVAADDAIKAAGSVITALDESTGEWFSKFKEYVHSVLSTSGATAYGDMIGPPLDQLTPEQRQWIHDLRDGDLRKGALMYRKPHWIISRRRTVYPACRP
jgi:polyhydroxyalkanoate synthesis regulator phasin